MIEDEAEKKRVSFAKVVVSRVRETFDESWEQTEMDIRRANREIAKWNVYKLQKKRIRLKEINRRKLKKMESEAKIKQREDEDSMMELQNVIRDVKRIQNHLEGRETIWINNYDPNDWLVDDEQPDPDYRKLPKGELNPELLDFYNKNIKYLK
tara:strand:+ start:226 stop:684 length:459 start_codon:yes stop_codon:yes gene_type:complete